MSRSASNSNGRIFVGAILIIIGSFLFLRNFHFELFDIQIFSWPVFLVIIGIIILANHKDSFFGVVLILIGASGIASNYFDISFRDVISEYWPFMLIIFGIYLILKHSSFGEKNDSEFIESEEYYLDLFSLLGKKNKVVKSNRFLGGKISSILGEVIVDLRKCNIADGNRELDVLTLFGSSDIYIPQDWNVIIKTTTIFGGFEDMRGSSFSSEKSANTLVLNGLVLFGGGEIKS